MNITSFFPLVHLGDLLLYLFWGFIFFMVIRELMTWYWKINKITDLLEKIKELLENKTEATGEKPESKLLNIQK